MGKPHQPSSVVHNVDFPSRVKASTPLGTTLLVILRAADVFLQYNLLSRWGGMLIKSAGGRVTELALDGSGPMVGLHPYYFGLVCLVLGSSMKQTIWVLFTSEQEMPVVAALMIATFNTVFNSINSLLSLWTWSSAATSEPLASTTFLLGVALFVIVILFEHVSEIQRKMLKSDPKNKGKPYAGGLFSIALNINYGAIPFGAPDMPVPLRVCSGEASSAPSSSTTSIREPSPYWISIVRSA